MRSSLRTGAKNTLLAEIIAMTHLRTALSQVVARGAIQAGTKTYVRTGKWKWEFIFELEATGTWKLFHVIVRSAK